MNPLLNLITISDTPEAQLVERVLLVCLTHAHRRRVPPNWWQSEWYAELRQIATLTILQLLKDYVPETGLPLETFLGRHVNNAVRTFYRHEWAYASRFLPLDFNHAQEEDNRTEIPEAIVEPAIDSILKRQDLKAAISKLSEEHRSVIISLFFDQQTESEIGQALHLGRRAVNSRKHAALKSLR